MTPDTLRFQYRPQLETPRLVLGFSGWMDGGEVSTGTIEYLVRKLGAKPFATIDPAEFYMYNHPGSMELTALFRPHTRIEDGIVQEFEEPTNTFYCSESHNIILFAGREPNMHWQAYCDALFTVVTGFGVGRMCFVGSVAGLIPHTKPPVFWSSATSTALRAVTEAIGLNPTNYEGPASFGTYLITRAKDVGVEMATIVAGVPAYVEGRNATCIEAAVEKVASFLEFDIETNDLKIESKQFVQHLDKIVEAKPEFREHIEKLEAAYEEQSAEDTDDSGLDEVREWFERQGMRFN